MGLYEHELSGIDTVITRNNLKTWLHRNVSRLDKLLLILATFDDPCTLAQLNERGLGAGLKIKSSWAPSTILSRSKGLAIRTPAGWEITDAGRQHLRKLGVSSSSSVGFEVTIGLRTELAKIANKDTRAFIEEAIKCYEAHLYRSAIVMSWLAAIDVVQRHIITNHLSTFNAEAKRVDVKWKAARTADDIGRMRETDLLDRLVSIAVIGKNVKAELKACLDRRNGCGHPNSLKIGANTVTHHIEVLLLNVFEPFAS